MNDSSAVLAAMFLAGAGMETWRELRLGHFPPRPFRFTGLAVAYALLSLLSKLSGPLAGVLGLGLLIALAVKLPSSPSASSSSTTGSGGAVSI